MFPFTRAPFWVPNFDPQPQHFLRFGQEIRVVHFGGVESQMVHLGGVGFPLPMDNSGQSQAACPDGYYKNGTSSEGRNCAICPADVLKCVSATAGAPTGPVPERQNPSLFASRNWAQGLGNRRWFRILRCGCRPSWPGFHCDLPRGHRTNFSLESCVVDVSERSGWFAFQTFKRGNCPDAPHICQSK